MPTITEVEMGSDYITIYGDDHAALLELGSKLYKNLPKELQKVNRKHLAHMPGDIPRFHPHGDPYEMAMEHPAHLHVIYKGIEPSLTQLEDLLTLIVRVDHKWFIQYHLEIFKVSPDGDHRFMARRLGKNEK